MAIDASLLAAVASDPELQLRTKRLLLKMLDEAEYLLDNGAPSVRVNLIRSGVGYLLREMRGGEDDDATITDLRAEFKGIMRELKESNTLVVEDAIIMDPDEDEPSRPSTPSAPSTRV